MPAKIRPFSDTDLDAVLDIAVAAWTPIFASFLSILGPRVFESLHPEWQADKRSQVAEACAGKHGASVCVAVADGIVVGFISYYLDRPPGVGEVGNNAVHPDHQGKGIGPMMYEHVLAQMKQACLSGNGAWRILAGGVA